MTPDDPSPEQTGLLERLRSSDPAVQGELFELLYGELKSIASVRLRGSGQSLQTTELVHEAYLKLVGSASATYADRTHFCAVAATAMRQILVDRARARGRAKRGGALKLLPIASADAVVLEDDFDVLALDEALTNLAVYDERLAHVVVLRSFGGLSVDEVAAVLQRSPRSVSSDWRTARAWLRSFLMPRSSRPGGGE